MSTVDILGAHLAWQHAVEIIEQSCARATPEEEQAVVAAHTALRQRKEVYPAADIPAFRLYALAEEPDNEVDARMATKRVLAAWQWLDSQHYLYYHPVDNYIATLRPPNALPMELRDFPNTRH